MASSESLEAGYPVAHYENSPSERDLFSLSMSPFGDMIEAFKTMSVEDLEETNIPPRATQIARLIMARTVGFIRLGSPREMGDAAVSLSSMVSREGAKEPPVGGFANPVAARIVSAASMTLVSAARPDSRGSEMNILHQDSEDRPIAETLRFILDSSEGATRPDLKENLVLEDELLDGVLHDLFSSGLAEKIPREDPLGRYFASHNTKAGLPHVRKMIDGSQ